MNVGEVIFYNPACISILPMGFCYPGKAMSGDLLSRLECAPLWHPQAFKNFKSKLLILLIGQYAQRYYSKIVSKETLQKKLEITRNICQSIFHCHILLPEIKTG
jgi:uracil-DNA glycosylase